MKNQKKNNPFKVNHVRSIKSKAKAKAYSGRLKKLIDLVKTKVENIDNQLKNIEEIVRQTPEVLKCNSEMSNNTEGSMKKKIIEQFKKTEINTEEALAKLETWSCSK
uniref:Uncharacterized protein n=1 Tax=Rhodnius prolixus TaxID=13249 RepID=T1HU09_RHOPR